MCCEKSSEAEAEETAGEGSVLRLRGGAEASLSGAGIQPFDILLPESSQSANRAADQIEGVGGGASTLRIPATSYPAAAGRVEDQSQTRLSPLQGGRAEFTAQNLEEESQRAARADASTDTSERGLEHGFYGRSAGKWPALPAADVSRHL